MENKVILDNIQNAIYKELKPIGFKKKGRTFNRTTEIGITQVINFQAGQYPLGDSYVIPGLRENLYGKFTVNLGVCVEELYTLSYQAQNFYKEYDCQFRERLGSLMKGPDYWWSLTDNIIPVINDINDGLTKYGLPWLDLFGTRDKIQLNWTKNTSSRAKLDFGIIMLKINIAEGQRILKEYINEIKPSKNGHKQYVIELVKELGLVF